MSKKDYYYKLILEKDSGIVKMQTACRNKAGLIIDVKKESRFGSPFLLNTDINTIT